ncbi:hypothetical protein SISNIDRAFT_439283 [Sistotremastrum niveocremeum HHB9708]|uniref:Sodium/calcium exchanger membrane region domain-containing protein n=1 Tax=Sistotremastrum niveocremeum HHB9708 TaxID=1314777 RepID=A0A164WPR0_9AGAM|nr:hypothetical protein SISNIDRAFT_439283 [Sistotremastrum niveocremeum HHB9708]
MAEDLFERGYEEAKTRYRRFWDRLRGKGRNVPGWKRSLKNIIISSPLNVLFVFLPVAWVARWKDDHFSEGERFAFAFLAIIPLETMFQWGGEQMALYLGKELGDLMEITLHNAVEAALAIFLLAKCELRLVQSTIIGVIILHLLLIPGTSFLIGGARILEQNLHEHNTQLNHSLLTLGVMTIMLPTAFFTALDRGDIIGEARTGENNQGTELLTDDRRGQFLQFSRALALLLLGVYICSRIFLHNPPGELTLHEYDAEAPEIKKEEQKVKEKLREEDPELNPWICILLLAVTIGIMAPTAEWLVDAVAEIEAGSSIQDEWLGLFLLPLVSFGADAAVATLFFLKKILFLAPEPPAELARGIAIDLSIQFALFWMPFCVVLGWWINKPLTLLFDLFEVSVLIATCFLVNYVTADSKTNWAEGVIMIAFYAMIGVVAWFYPGQEEIIPFMKCAGVGETLSELINGTLSQD